MILGLKGTSLKKYVEKQVAELTKMWSGVKGLSTQTREEAPKGVNISVSSSKKTEATKTIENLKLDPFASKEAGFEKLFKESIRGKVSDKDAEAFGDYSGQGYETINRNLRKGGDGGKQKTEATERTGSDLVKSMDNVMAQASMSRDVTAYRAVDSSVLSKLKKAADTSKLFEDKGFVSTTTDPKRLEDEFDATNLVRVHISRGTRAVPLAGLIETDKPEMEIVIDRGTKFAVKSGKDGVLELHVARQR